MAHVNLSGELQTKIIDSATKGLGQQIAETEQKIRNCFSAEAIYAALVPKELQAKLKEIPIGFLETTTVVTARMAHAKGEYSWNVNFSGPKPINPQVTNRRWTIPATTDGYHEAVPLMERRSRLMSETIVLRSKLEETLNQCRTLKQAVAAWPTVLDHVPPEIRAKHNEKATPRSVTEIKPLDEQAQSVLVKSTMLAK
jgi:hypothetical protein